jgi:hypothetical protein
MKVKVNGPTFDRAEPIPLEMDADDVVQVGGTQVALYDCGCLWEMTVQKERRCGRNCTENPILYCG